MSYILDALRRADAERRGAIAPGELTAPGVLTTDHDELPQPHRPLPWLLAGTLVAAFVWGLWAWMQPEPLPPAELEAAAPLAPPPAPNPAPAPAVPPATLPAALPAALPVSTAAAPAAQGSTEPLPPVLAALAQTPAAPKRALPPAASAAPMAALANTSGNTSTHTPGKPAATAAVPSEVPTLAELPESLRRELPQFTISGAMYSERPADRMLIINGQFFHEGDSLGKGVVVRQIRLKAAVLEFRGQRYLVRY